MHSILTAAYSDPMIIAGVLQLNDRMKSNPAFSYALSKANPDSTYCQKKTRFSAYFFRSSLKYYSGGIYCN